MQVFGLVLILRQLQLPLLSFDSCVRLKQIKGKAILLEIIMKRNLSEF